MATMCSLATLIVVLFALFPQLKAQVLSMGGMLQGLLMKVKGLFGAKS